MLLTVLIFTIGFTYGVGIERDDSQSMKVLKQVEIGPGGKKYLALRIPIPIERGLSIKVLPRRKDDSVLTDDEAFSDECPTVRKGFDSGESLFNEMTSGKTESKVFKEGSIESSDLNKNNIYLSDTLHTRKPLEYEDYPSTFFSKDDPKVDEEHSKQAVMEFTTRGDYEELMISGVTCSGSQKKYDNQDEESEEMEKYRTAGQMSFNQKEPSKASSPKIWIVPMSWTTVKSGQKMKNQIRGKIKDQNLSNKTTSMGKPTAVPDPSEKPLVKGSTFRTGNKEEKVGKALSSNKTQETGTRAGRHAMERGENTVSLELNAPPNVMEEQTTKKKKGFGPIPKKWLEDKAASENPLSKITPSMTFDKSKNKDHFRVLSEAVYNQPDLSDGLPSSITETYQGVSTTLSTLSPIEIGLVAFSKKINNSFANKTGIFRNHKGNKTRTIHNDNNETTMET